MTLKHRTELTKLFELAYVEITLFCKCGVKRGAAVALGKHEAIARFHFGILRVDVHFVEIEVGDYVGNRQRSARMAAFCAVDRFDRMHSYPCGSFFQR